MLLQNLRKFKNAFLPSIYLYVLSIFMLIKYEQYFKNIVDFLGPGKIVQGPLIIITAIKLFFYYNLYS